MLSRPADARVRARFRVGAKRGVFRGENGGGAGVFCTMAFEQNVGRSGGKTRKIRPSGGDLCSFRYVAGRSVQDCGKVVQKLAGREDENHKLCTTLCAPLRLGTRIVQVSFPLGVRCVGVVVRRCAIRSFSLPPAEAGCPFRRRGRGRRQTGAGCCARGRPPLPSPSPTLRSALRPSAGGSAAVDKLTRGERTGRSGDSLVHSAFAHGTSPISGQGRGSRQAVAGHCARGRPPLPSRSPTLRSATRDTGPQRRDLFPTAARTLPGSGRRANDILYIRVRRREAENVLHRAVSNDVDNFSVDNPLWITTAAGG